MKRSRGYPRQWNVSSPLLLTLTLGAALLPACSDASGGERADVGPAFVDGSIIDGGANAPELDAHVAHHDGSGPEASQPPVEPGDANALLLERGRYLVENVAMCGDCHTPRRSDRSFDRTRLLAGVNCFVDVLPADPQAGCLNSANLTNHETGLKNRSDQQIKDMIMKGIRHDGRALDPTMPYAVFGNMADGDADAIVAYLRRVPAVSNQIAPSQAPWVVPTMPEARFPEARIPLPRADYVDRQAAMRGRYLAGNVGICMQCHTPRDAQNQFAFDKVFQGGNAFPSVLIGLNASFPDLIFSSNITPHENGIAGWTVEDIVRALKLGKDKDQGDSPLCPPMPAGPMSAFGGLSDEDARDIGHYLLSLPAGDNLIPEDCQMRTP